MGLALWSYVERCPCRKNAQDKRAKAADEKASHWSQLDYFDPQGHLRKTEEAQALEINILAQKRRACVCRLHKKSTADQKDLMSRQRAITISNPSQRGSLNREAATSVTLADLKHFALAASLLMFYWAAKQRYWIGGLFMERNILKKLLGSFAG